MDEDSVGIAFAPLLVGITGKLNLDGAEDAVRRALDHAFGRLDARCPSTPKVLLTGLARGADTIAAQAALARSGWSVIAVLPFSRALFLEDFSDEGSRATFLALCADPRVKTLALAPLRKGDHGAAFTEAELTRSAAESPPFRAEHYEQVGLFISERCAVMLAVMDAQEQPGRVGGTARLVHQRILGQLDETSRGIVRRSSLLIEPPRLVDRHPSAVWIVDLARLAPSPQTRDSALLVWAPTGSAPTPLGASAATHASLALADTLERLNRSFVRLGEGYWRGQEDRIGPHSGSALFELQRLRAAVSDVQMDLMRSVRHSIRWLATLSCLAILALEVYIGGPRRPWALSFELAYPVFVVLAVMVYAQAARLRWQPLAEDYRAVAEALRVQTVWWASGLNEMTQRVERFYLRDAHGALRQLRALIVSMVDGALLRFGPSETNPQATERWASGQISYFKQRIARRRRELGLVETSTWFLFAASFSIAVAITGVRGLDVPSKLIEVVGAWSDAQKWTSVLVTFGAVVVMFLVADRIQDRASADGEELSGSTVNYPSGVLGLAAGAVATLCLCLLAINLKGDQEAWAEELLAFTVAAAATLAGAIRFVSDKSSWTTELTGYEHALRHFERGLTALRATAGAAAEEEAERREVVLAMGMEALVENENWLRAHRERPIEPIVGG